MGITSLLTQKVCAKMQKYMELFLRDFSILHPILVYFIIFMGIALEGDLVLFTSAFFAHQGFLDPGIIVGVTILGISVRDILWYEIGSRVENSKNRIVIRAWKMAAPFDDHLEKRLFQSVLIAKFVYGLHLAIVMRIGALKIPLREFVKADLLAALAWIFVVGGLGVLSSKSVLLFSAQDYLQYTEIFLGIAIFFYLIFHSIIGRISKRFL